MRRFQGGAVNRAWERAGVVAAVVVLVALVASGCSEKEKQATAGSATTGSGTTDSGTTAKPAGNGSVVERFAGKTTTLGVIPAKRTKATGTPIAIGMINQETGAAAVLPELSIADKAGLRFINEELGGVDGHPITLELCDTKFSPEGSQRCAQQMVQNNVAAVMGGIDVFGDGIKILADNGIPFVGGIPVSFASAQSPNSFQFSGGSWGAFVSLAHYAAKNLHAKKISIMYSEFPPITDAADMTKRALAKLGVTDVRLVPMPIVATDLTAPLTQANEGNPDAIIVGAADAGCVPALKGSVDLQIKAKLLFVGACAAPTILKTAGDAASEGKFFNVEIPIDTKAKGNDVPLYNAVIAKYGGGIDAQSAGTVSFEALMNLYVAMKEIGAAKVSPKTITDQLRAARDHPTFMGHPYTCDGKQIPTLPALCAPQGVIGERVGSELLQRTGWIDVPALVK